MDIAITLFPLLPVVVATIAFRRGSRLALVPLVIFTIQLAWWLAYTFTDWIDNPGMAGVWSVFIFPTIAGLVVAVISLLQNERSAVHDQKLSE